MNNKTIAIVLGVLVVLGGVYFGFIRNTDNTQNNTVSNNEETLSENENLQEIENSDRKMSFSSFLKQGGSYVCTVNQSVGGIDSKGTVYINDSNIRGEFNTAVAGMNVDSFLIVKDNFTYTWSSMMPGKGFKAIVSTGTNGDTNTQTSGQYSFNAEQIGEYDCKPWQVDPSKFILPSGVVFTEIKN